MNLNPNFRRWSVTALLALLAVVLLAEMALRLSGVTDFPVYDTDEHIGYIPAPQQKGQFLNRNAWQVNERSMGSPPWQPYGQRDVLLLGDSVVWGGNPLNHPDKLGPLLQARLPQWRVWSASAGSWSVLNEIAYLDRYADVQQEADVLVWVLNTGDLVAQRSVWRSDDTHPRSKPHSALAYVVQKYLLARWMPNQQPATSNQHDLLSAEVVQALQQRLAQLSKDKRVLMVLYPNQAELQAPTPHYLAFRDALRTAMDGCCSLLELRDVPQWQAGLYRDDIHPTAEGNRVLAEAVAGWAGRQ